MDPSHMKAEGVDDWLKHWIKLQKRNKRPLTLKDPSAANSDQSKAPEKGSGKGKGKGKARATSPSPTRASSDTEDAENMEDFDKGEDTESDEAKSINGDSAGTLDDDEDIPKAGSSLPLAPASAAKSKKTRFAFLKSLSDDKTYSQLLRLLYAAQVSQIYYLFLHSMY
jgi:hypothetical protein